MEKILEPEGFFFFLNRAGLCAAGLGIGVEIDTIPWVCLGNDDAWRLEL